MTEFKYGPSNYNKKLSTADRANATTATNNNLTTAASKPSSMDENSRRPHPRLKKSFSECEYYENVGCPAAAAAPSGLEVNFNLSPSKRKFRETAVEHHHRLKQASINDIAFIDGGGKMQYNYDTLKSQYLLQQQQKLKEYKNDPNYLPNGDNYSSESSTETRGILKNNAKSLQTSAPTTDAHNKNSLRRNKGLSTLSLCSCDAETEVTMPSIPFIPLIFVIFPVLAHSLPGFFLSSQYLPKWLRGTSLIGR